MVKIYIEDMAALSIIKRKIQNLRSFEIDIEYPNAKLTVWMPGTGKGLGMGGPRLRKQIYSFTAEDGDNFFCGMEPQLDGFQNFILMDDEIEVYAKGEVTSYVSIKHNISLDNIGTDRKRKINIINGGSNVKKMYKGREYKIRKGERNGKYIIVKGKKIYV